MEAVMNMPLAASKEAIKSCSFVQEEHSGNISAKFGSSAGDQQSSDGGKSSKSSSLSLKDSAGLNRQSSMEIASELRSSAMDLSSSLPSSSTSKSSITFSKKEQLESTKAEIGEVGEENEKLKMVLARKVKDYQALQVHFFDVMQRERPPPPPKDQEPDIADGCMEEDLELVSLSLGTSSSTKKAEKASKQCKSKEGGCGGGAGREDGGGLTLGLVPEDSSDGEAKAGDDVEAAGPSGKRMRSSTNGEEDEQASQHAHVKKARVSVRARCDAPTMNDGCQWRKYGQKIAKGNPCPRAYYRCTVAPACPVRKQVQRCSDDMSILITTYEGTHNHPLPFSATAMASTTSAAVSMLMSGSSAAGPPPPTVSPAALNFGGANSRPAQFYLPRPSMDPSCFAANPRPPPSTSFSFSSSESSGTTSSSAWSNGYQNYGALQLNKALLGPSSFYQSWLQSAPAAAEQSPLSTETIAKSVASDPSFRSALTAAISSYVGNGGKGTNNGIMKWAESMNPSG